VTNHKEQPMTEIPPFRGTFDLEQTKALLNPINPARVFTANGQSHVPYFEVVAHLIRVFGFGNHMIEVLGTELVFETLRPESQAGNYTRKVNNVETEFPKSGAPNLWRYDVCYRAMVRLTIFDRAHNLVTFFENVSTGDASNQTRADGHDLALKSAVSLATKRCAINLGDQWGLSLYNKGKRTALVVGTKVLPTSWDSDATAADPSAHVEQVESDGIDETEKVDEVQPAVSDPEAEQRLADSLGAKPVEA
jgi:Rad52/22 family double-strand break repair protein